MQTELLDYFDENLQYLGTASRSEIHQKGLWHKTFHCWIIGRENEENYLLFQRRSLEKQLHPNKLDITAAGHLLAGETEKEGARELSEELGIHFDFDDLLFLGIRKDISRVNGEINCEFCYTYFLERNLPLSAYQLQTAEVAGLYKIKVQDCLDLFLGKLAQVNALTSNNQNPDNQMLTQIAKTEILAHPDAYYLQIFDLVNQYFDGKKPIRLT